jgi:hypothetical protein
VREKDVRVGRTRQDNEVRDGYAITSDYEAAALLSNDDSRSPLFFVLVLGQIIIDIQVGILGIAIAHELNLVTLIDRLPA